MIAGSDDFTVSGGGTTRVATDAVIGHALTLDAAAGDLGAARRSLRSIDRGVSAAQLVDVDAPLSAARAETAIDDAVALLEVAETDAERLAFALRVCADAYGATEHALAGLAQLVAARTALGIGYLGSSVGVVALGLAAPFLVGGGLGLAMASALFPGALSRVTGRLGDGLAEQRAALSSPLLVSITRLGVMSADDLGAGLLRMPVPLAALLGDEGLGILGLDTSAGVLVGAAAGAGMLKETPVRVSAVATSPSTPATGFADRASRIPTATASGGQAARPQIRIDRYTEAGRADRFEVYVGGTLDFSPTATREPWDLTSNVRGVAGSDAAGSYRAVEQALADAGADRDSEVVITGYSQGGLVAAMLAASDDHTVTGLYTLGAPAAQVPVPADVPWVAVEHTDDLVPALGGTWESTAPVVVRREAFDGSSVESDLFFPAHELTRYRESAALLDTAADPRIGRVCDTLDGARGDVVVESTWFQASRTP